jgi:hypothetical protein
MWSAYCLKISGRTTAMVAYIEVLAVEVSGLACTNFTKANILFDVQSMSVHHWYRALVD